MAVTELELARHDHEQAKRAVRRLAQERLHQRSNGLDRLYYDARDRVEATLARLVALEATRPDGAGTRHPT